MGPDCEVGLRIFGFVLFWGFLSASFALAQESDFERRLGEITNPPIVGQLTIESGGYCTATLIASDLVVASESCVQAKHSVARSHNVSGSFRFFPANGGAERTLDAVVSRTHRSWDHADNSPLGNATLDFRLFRLARPIPRHLGVPTRLVQSAPDYGEAGLFASPNAVGETYNLRSLCRMSRILGARAAIECPNEPSAADPLPVFMIVGGELQLVSVMTATRDPNGSEAYVGVDIRRFGQVTGRT